MDDMTEEALETIESVSNEEFEQFRTMFLDAVNGLSDESFSAIMPKIYDVVYSFGLIGDEQFEKVIVQAKRCLEIDKHLFALCKLLLTSDLTNAEKGAETNKVDSYGYGEIFEGRWETISSATKKKDPNPHPEEIDPIHDQLVDIYGLEYFGKIGSKKLYTGTREKIYRVDSDMPSDTNGWTDPIDFNKISTPEVIHLVETSTEGHFFFTKRDADMLRFGDWLDYEI